MTKFLFLFVSLFFVAAQVGIARQPYTERSAEYTIKATQLVTGLGVIWGMAFIGKNQLLFTERNGRVAILNTASRKLSPVAHELRVLARGQGGLLDVAVPAGYRTGDQNNGWIYFTYVTGQRGFGVTVLARAQLANRPQGRQLVAWQKLLVSESASSSSRHFGSRIAFDNAGHVFFSIGDRGVRDYAQDLSNHAGSIVRLKLDGSVPTDNPFATNRSALKEIYSFGHRNPQGLYYDQVHKRLWAIEHGPRGGDEINLIHAGKNYGWPVISYGQEYGAPVAVGIGTHKEGMEQPNKVYTPSIAPSGLLVYSGKLFEQWRSNLLAGALKLRHLNRTVPNKRGQIVAEERLLLPLKERVRQVIEDWQGVIYISTDSGKILKIEPAAKN